MKKFILSIKFYIIISILLLLLLPFGYFLIINDDDIQSCIEVAKGGLLEISDDRSKRFLGKVQEDTARCRGGDKAVKYLNTPWVDWQNYYATGDADSRLIGHNAITKLGKHLRPNGRGIDGALLDLEYQRIELIKFNLFDQYTYQEYIKGRDDGKGSSLKQWDEMRLPPNHIHYQDVGGDNRQICKGALITHRTQTGICNDLINPLMGSTGMSFTRNMQFETTFPELELNELTKNRHANRIDLLKPDPQLISRKLFTRQQSKANGCNQGWGGEGFSPNSKCDYLKAPFMNVLSAFWIQFMTHDWFSHTNEGRNSATLKPVGCFSDESQSLGCREDDRFEQSLYVKTTEAGSFEYEGRTYQKSSAKTTKNYVSAWWDASQIYGYDGISQKRVQRDPHDRAKLLIKDNYLPLLPDCKNYSEDCPVQSQWHGQEAASFPDNWNIGMSFYHNLFSREHNYFVNKFRVQQKTTPNADSGLRNPESPNKVIIYKDVNDERLYQVTRLIVSAQIAKIHTIEWTTQLLYNEPLYAGMNSNWFGLFNNEEDRVSKILRRILEKDDNFISRVFSNLTGWFSDSSEDSKSNTIYSVLASGTGIFGLGNKKSRGMLWWKHDSWNLNNLESDVNGGINHFGSPFNFPEEFTSVYRLHAMIPDLIEFRENDNPDIISLNIPVIDTIRANATKHMHTRGIENWALSMGRQRIGQLHLRNMPLFLQNLPMPHLDSKTKILDIAALDIIRDRERGIPRFNEFRRQIGLKTLTSFDDFINQKLDKDNPWRQHQEMTVSLIREIYGKHKCDASKIISKAQRNANGSFINDCLGHADGSEVDNIEDMDNIVGWMAEYTRPHGFAISETQFHIFILNASRRLFSDRFFTSSFRPEFYSRLGYDWVINNGPLSDCPYTLTRKQDGKPACLEPGKDNGHRIPVSPLKRLLLRNIPEIKEEILHIKNAFDPWARDRGIYYSLDWKSRPGAESDPVFTGQ